MNVTRYKLFKCNKCQFYTFLLELLTKKVCSVSFVRQYIDAVSKEIFTNGEHWTTEDVDNAEG